ncbi:unnamed protein product [Cylicostephanus goldi]|uniref:Uncharacterized protein n=1 Tax=Cylicostephanus goldi TaxID=71465 RepID=A0A3P6RTH5_CYLGO|nr:unnamed protein product [Cylicostephanus goldi]
MAPSNRLGAMCNGSKLSLFRSQRAGQPGPLVSLCVDGSIVCCERFEQRCVRDDAALIALHRMFSLSSASTAPMPSISAALIEAARTKESLYDADENEQSSGTPRTWRCSFKRVINLFTGQFYPHHLKMFVLFVIAALHLAYTREFLTTFRAYESLANQVEYRASPEVGNQADINLVRFVMIALIDVSYSILSTECNLILV